MKTLYISCSDVDAPPSLGMETLLPLYAGGKTQEYCSLISKFKKLCRQLHERQAKLPVCQTNFCYIKTFTIKYTSLLTAQTDRAILKLKRSITAGAKINYTKIYYDMWKQERTNLVSHKVSIKRARRRSRPDDFNRGSSHPTTPQICGRVRRS